MKYDISNRYRAYTEYRRFLKEDSAHVKRLRTVSSSLDDKGKFESVCTWCEVKTDWIEMIENGIEYIGKAIDEQRQFIRQDGSVVPIEKARRVSKESTIHLAQHSELLSGEPGDKITPEKIYMKENQSNYLVYENKFLYMALCYIRDFVDIRYKGIMEADNSYKTELSLQSTHSIKGKKLAFDLNFHESSADDAYTSVREENTAVMERIQNIRFAISAYLNTDLMIELSKAPMLRPPITPTNVLRMDNAFREVYLLYTKIVTYADLGYDIFEKKLTFAPLSQELAEDVSESILYYSFLTYMYGHEMEGVLSKSLEDEYLEEHKRELEDYKVRLDKLKEELSANGAEYISALEKHAMYLEGQKEYWSDLAEQNFKLKASLEATERACEELRNKYAKLEETYEAACEESRIAVRNAEEQGRTALREAEDRFENEKKEMQQKHDERVEALMHDIDECNDRVRSKAMELESARAIIGEKDKMLEQAREEQYVLKAKLRVADPSQLEDMDYTEQENFDDLEKERAAYERFFNKTWKKAKAKIRRDYFWKRRNDDARDDMVSPENKGETAADKDAALSTSMGASMGEDHD